MSGRKGSRKVGSIHALPVEEDVRKEIEAHLEAETEALIAEGWRPSEARDEALRRFGEVSDVQEACERIAQRARHAERRARWWEGVRLDLRLAMRRLVRSPGFSLVAILTVALGVGANTAIFSLIEDVLLAPLPYAEADRLVSIEEEHEGGRGGPIPWPNYVDIRAQTRTLDRFALYGVGSTTVLGGSEPVRTTVAAVSRDFFFAFSPRPVLGRTLNDEDHRPGAAPAAMVSEGFWRQQMGADPAALERPLRISGDVVQVVGVLPQSFDFPQGTEVWLTMDELDQSQSRTAHNWYGVGRVAEGSDAAAADEELDLIVDRMAASISDEFDAVGGVVTPLQESLTGDSRTPLLVLMAASFLILLIACVNLAGILLARGTTRMNELAVRSALGARRGRLVRQLLTESVVLAVAGGLAGILLAMVINHLTARTGAAMLPTGEGVSLSLSVLAFALGLTLFTSLLMGLLPALRLASDGIATETRSSERGGEAPNRRATWRWLVGSEVALALMLLIGTGLLVRSFARMLAQDTGAHTEGVAVAQIAPSPERFDSLPDVASWYGALLGEIQATPGIAEAGIANTYPISGGTGNGRVQLDGDMSLEAYGYYVAASPGYFTTLNIPLLRGRLFDDRDRAGSLDVALVSQSFADEAWPGLDPVGRQVSGGGMDNYWDQQRFATVVGVVGDVRYRGLGQPAEPTLYFPLAQRPFRARSRATVVARANTADAAGIQAAIRATISRFDPELPPRIRSLDQVLGDSVADRRFVVGLLGAFAAVALILSIIGIYSVVSYRVARRTREIGVRVALGARPGEVLSLVMRDSMGMVAGGLVFGVVGALVGGALLRSQLFGITTYDPVTFVVAVPLLATGAALATWVPARRAMKVPPTVAIRTE